MSMLRKAEVSLMSFLYRNRTIRLAKKRTDILKKLSISSFIIFFFFQWDYKLDRYIRETDKIAKPQSFMIDGPDPFQMSEKEWDTVQAHYLHFYYR
jgi:hypothetical protein